MMALATSLYGATLALALAAPECAHAAEVRMAIGESLAPYVISAQDGGLEYDIVREALALEGHTLKPHFTSPVRVARDMQAGLVDAAMTMRPGTPGLQAYYSDSHVSYQNYAITLAQRHVRIDSIADLAGRSILAFQNAATNLGPEYRAVTKANPAYREDSRQELQPTMLYLGRVDVIIADRHIFEWYAHTPEVTTKVDSSQPLEFHPIFPATDYHVAFRDQSLRDSFNKGLVRLRESGGYDRILARYAQGPKN